MRSTQEIIDRINEVQARDWMGTQTSDLLLRLEFEDAKPFLKDTAKAEEWKVRGRDRESLIAEMLDYMPFAWDKAINCRGISAGRSMDHYTSWVWLAGDDLGDLTDYEFYGKDNLRKICDHYGFEADKWDDGVRVNSEDEAA